MVGVHISGAKVEDLIVEGSILDAVVMNGSPFPPKPVLSHLNTWDLPNSSASRVTSQ